MNRVVLKEKFSKIKEYWDPKIIGEVNNMHIKIAKIKGEFAWHLHENEDELFLVVEGKMVVRFRGKEVPLEKDEIVIVPRGVEHQPAAEEETLILMMELKGTLNTGNIKNERTVSDPEWI